jgi:DNA invertase Pin-like site-specific DNA recombinase
MEPTPKAYAYIRFSSSKQKDGDSIRRQLESARNYCAEHKIILDEREFNDFAKSAYRKANIQKGSALSAFIALVDSGEIPRGSILLLESLDRLTRADIYSAITLLGSILMRGIVIIETAKNQTFTQKTLTEFLPMLNVLSTTLVAFDESSKKAVRSAANWDRRQSNARQFSTPLTRECPRWLRVSEDGTKYEILHDKVRSIEQVFEMRKSGLGASAIARKCNELKLPVPGKGDIWHLSLVNRLIKNTALVGNYQPFKINEAGIRVPHGDPIPYFYPVVINPTLFKTVLQINQKSKEFPTKRDKVYRNFLQGLLFCSCGASMHRKLKSRLDLDYSRYYCSRQSLNASKCSSIDCKTIEDTVIFFMSEEAPGLLSDDQRADPLRVAEENARNNVVAIERQIQLLLNVIQAGEAKDAPASLLERLNALEKNKASNQEIAERYHAASTDKAVDWGIKADENFIKSIRAADPEKLSLLRFQIARLVERFELTEDLKTLKVKMKNDRTAEISTSKEYFDAHKRVKTL